jgi:carboxylate-amine ligase
MLLDPQSLQLVPRIDALLEASAGGALAGLVKPELLQSVVEATTPVCTSAGELYTALRRQRSEISALARAQGCRIASAGTHPFGLFEQQPVTDRERYRTMVDEYQLIARSQLIFGLHIHAAVDDPEKAIQVVDGLLVYLAAFLALSANSPFWRGAPTGLLSSRQMIFSSLPRSGMPPRFASYGEFAELVGVLERSGCMADYTSLWWDVRPHPRFGTVELRICDAVTRVEDAVAIAAYYQCLVKHLGEQVEAGRGVASYHRVLTTENKWLAARHGLDARVIDLTADGVGRIPLREFVRRSLAELTPHARELGSERELEGVEEILGRGAGATAQLASWEASHDLASVVRELAEATEPGEPLAPPSR